VFIGPAVAPAKGWNTPAAGQGPAERPPPADGDVPPVILPVSAAGDSNSAFVLPTDDGDLADTFADEWSVEPWAEVYDA